MTKLPEPGELISFFDSEPTVLDPDVPRAYNSLRFARQSGNETIECVIGPGYSQVKFRWIDSGTDRVRLNLEGVQEISYKRDAAGELLSLEIDDQQHTHVDLRMHPRVQVSVHQDPTRP